MPTLLAIETSSDICSVALWRDGQIRSLAGAAGEPHSELVLPFVRSLLAEAGTSLDQIDAIAYGAGPGGFTGLRLACGVAQGLAFGAGLPVIGVGSLEALAADAGRERVYVCVDARMNEVYGAACRVRGDDVSIDLPPFVAAPEEIPLPPGEGWHGCGSGFTAYADAIRWRLGARLASVDAAAVPSAVAVARLAARRFAAGVREDPAAAQPAYVRDKVAYTTAERLARGGVR